MKKLCHLLVVIAALASLGAPAFAQATFYGTDDFNDNSFASGRWSSFQTTNAGVWAETNGRLEFTGNASSTSITTANRVQQFRIWSSNTTSNTSYTDSWTANMTFTIDKTVVASNGVTMLGFDVHRAGTASGYYGIYLLYASSGGRIFSEQGVFNGSGFTRTTLGSTGTLDNAFDGTEVLLRVDYNGSTQSFTSAFSFDSGATYFNYGNFGSADASGGTAVGNTSAWLSAPTTGFGLEVYGALYGNGSATGPTLVSGQAFADNLSVSAIPEPSTYAAIFGAGALAFAFWRRRAPRPIAKS